MSFYFRPRQTDDKVVPLEWEVRLFFLNVSWPISDTLTWRMRLADKVMIVAAFLLFCLSNDAEMRYVVHYRNDIGLALEGMATYLVLIEMHCRIFSMAFKKNDGFKYFISEFYEKIYISSNTDRRMYRSIQQKLMPTKLCVYSYISTVVTYFAIPVIGFFDNRRLLPFRMLFAYDHTPLPIYIPTLLGTLWLGVLVVTHLAAETILMAMLILHLNARYLLLQQDLSRLHAHLKRSTRSDAVLYEFRHKLIEIIRRNVELNEFAAKMQQQYSFSIFVMMSLSAMLLCVLGFKAATLGMTTQNLTYLTWIVGKIIELVVFGKLGSTLIHTTDQMSSKYYLCNWEDVILDSTHTRDNVELMKLITLAVGLNQNPFYLTGFNYFKVSLVTVVSILQGAGSYFTFLYAFR